MSVEWQDRDGTDLSEGDTVVVTEEVSIKNSDFKIPKDTKFSKVMRWYTEDRIETGYVLAGSEVRLVIPTKCILKVK